MFIYILRLAYVRRTFSLSNPINAISIPDLCIECMYLPVLAFFDFTLFTHGLNRMHGFTI